MKDDAVLSVDTFGLVNSIVQSVMHQANQLMLSIMKHNNTWDIVAEATGVRGTTYAICRENDDGTYQLRDRCAEGHTEDGTAIDDAYESYTQLMWDAVKLVDIWVK